VRAGRLVIQADLVDVANGSQLWGGQYNRPLADILAVQDEISEEIFEKLRLRLTGEDKKRATRRYTENPDAYQLYLQGRYYWNKGTIAAYRTAVEYFQQAIDKDPKYALAYAGLADSYLLLGDLEATRQRWSEARTAYRRAIEVAFGDARGYRSLAGLERRLGNTAAAAAVVSADPDDDPVVGRRPHPVAHRHHSTPRDHDRAAANHGGTCRPGMGVVRRGGDRLGRVTAADAEGRSSAGAPSGP